MCLAPQMVISQRAAALLHWTATTPALDAGAADADGEPEAAAMLLQRLDLQWRGGTRGGAAQVPATAQGSRRRAAPTLRAGFVVAQLFVADFAASFDGAPKQWTAARSLA